MFRNTFQTVTPPNTGTTEPNYRLLKDPAVLNLVRETAPSTKRLSGLGIGSFHTLPAMCTKLDDKTYAPYVNRIVPSADK